MIGFILRKIMGTQNERFLKGLKPAVERINSLEPEIQRLSDGELSAKTDEFRKRIKDKLSAEKDSELAPEEESKLEKQALDEILPEAFAVVREVASRTLGMRHYDVQLIGGMVLYQGKIAEMANGEGKTLVATLPVYLNALTGKGVHVVTVNDYLAQRDKEWMGPVYEFLGLSVGVIQHDMPDDVRKRAYNADITYGTNNEFGFDYLRDNMKYRRQDMVQRKLYYAIVDELDSILIDEARTPLIISGPADESTDKYYRINKIIPMFKPGKKDEVTKEETGDYIVDEKAHTTYLTEAGEIKAAKLLGLEDLHTVESMEYRHHVNQALRAHKNFKRDVDYVVRDNQVIIVDEFTGRLMSGRRWSDGLHQAVEAKEGVRIERENQTLATITFQNYFRMYERLSGMTGTAATESAEFHEIYKLDVVNIPTNIPPKRRDLSDIIYKTEREKFNALCAEVVEAHKKGRPVLVGTISIDKSEHLSRLLKQKGVPHNVLNAKYHEMEAHIVAQAGRVGAVTIATNMAGRGTDIRLGGNAEFMAEDLLRQEEIAANDAGYKEERRKLREKFKAEVAREKEKVFALGGLYVLGTERHESRRIDNQLRGRAGRQGTPGASQFYLSLEDDLMRIFGSDRVAGIMERLGMEEGQEIQHPLVTRAIETAQRRVEAHNFDIRKQLLQYDNVMNRQREVIYEERRMVLEGGDLKEHIQGMIEDILLKRIDIYIPPDVHAEEWDVSGLSNWLRSKLAIDLGIAGEELREKNRDELKDLLIKAINQAYEIKEKKITPEVMEHLARTIMLQIIDSKWKDHLYSMDNLREGIGLRAYGQRDPLVEYQHEGYDMFMNMIESIKEETVEFLFKVQAVREERLSGVFTSLPQKLVHPEAGALGLKDVPRPERTPRPLGLPQREPSPEKPSQYKREGRKVGRNEPCPCGSGKKYKRCCGK